MTSFGEVAPLALMSGSIELLQAWVIETLGALADSDEPTARLRDTLRVFLQETAATRPRPNVSPCTRTRSSTGCARLRKGSDGPSPMPACMSKWPYWPVSGWAPPYCGRLASRRYARRDPTPGNRNDTNPG